MATDHDYRTQLASAKGVAIGRHVLSDAPLMFDMLTMRWENADPRFCWNEPWRDGSGVEAEKQRIRVVDPAETEVDVVLNIGGMADDEKMHKQDLLGLHMVFTLTTSHTLVCDSAVRYVNTTR